MSYLIFDEQSLSSASRKCQMRIWRVEYGSDDTLLDAEGVSAKERLRTLAQSSGESIETYYPKTK